MKTIRAVLCGFLVLSAPAIKYARCQPLPTPAGQTVLTFVNRLFINPPQVQVFGYFPTIEGIPGPLFSGAPGESTAYFTWTLDAAGASQLQNGDPAGGGISIAVLPAGRKLSIYYNPKPAQDWNVPASFSAGQLVATFQGTTGTQVGAGPVALVTQSYLPQSATDFTFNGNVYNLRQLLPHGFTFFTLSANAPVGNSSPPVPPLVFPAAGSAVAIGGALSALPRF